jgi:hypothetical protein
MVTPNTFKYPDSYIQAPSTLLFGIELFYGLVIIVLNYYICWVGYRLIPQRHNRQSRYHLLPASRQKEEHMSLGRIDPDSTQEDGEEGRKCHKDGRTKTIW